MLKYFTSQHNFTAIEDNEDTTITDDTERNNTEIDQYWIAQLIYV